MRNGGAQSTFKRCRGIEQAGRRRTGQAAVNGWAPPHPPAWQRLNGKKEVSKVEVLSKLSPRRQQRSGREKKSKRKRGKKAREKRKKKKVEILRAGLKSEGSNSLFRNCIPTFPAAAEAHRAMLGYETLYTGFARSFVAMISHHHTELHRESNRGPHRYNVTKWLACSAQLHHPRSRGSILGESRRSNDIA